MTCCSSSQQPRVTSLEGIVYRAACHLLYSAPSIEQRAIYCILHHLLNGVPSIVTCTIYRTSCHLLYTSPSIEQPYHLLHSSPSVAQRVI